MKHENGQAAPLYVTAVTGLLFLALVFFAFGEADVQRNGAQSAADASALAAAKQSRSLMSLQLKANVMNRAFYIAAFNAPFLGGVNGCGNAYDFAGRNDARITMCRPLYDGRWAYRVNLKSDKGMSANLVPRTEGEKAKADATAVVESRCKFIPNPVMTSPSIGEVICNSGLVWTVSPKDLATMPDMADLFSVRLAED
ncbi:pilus assembly protein TadG-related protein [Streptomyces sp. ITFR-16]|uniref:pilus assembly protein TadG-related protein n=1 Tax=Streptomyces sp. ITFR-16 TaxID=3075198 RepID=UPI00288AD740|nr:pilus assembly protein TadG-related protein [Streptomyces sp. ITFR-16]WNI22771.1 pilus assembly protein TadG-related protein [Streptomyces sp. ITFR-16]